MSVKTRALRFLADHPWSSARVLRTIFGPDFQDQLPTSRSRTVTVPGVGTCFGIQQEKLSSLPGTRRRERARLYLLVNYGPLALTAGGSPGPWGSDLLALAEKEKSFWLQLWVDPGRAAVEALPCLNPGPSRRAPNLAGVVLTTDLARGELIARQLQSRREGALDRVLIYCQMEGEYLRPGEPSRRGSGAAEKPLRREEVRQALDKAREKRLVNKRRAQNLGKLFLELSEADLALLTYVGDNPLFTAEELTVLASGSATSGSLFPEKRGQAQERAGRCLARLETLGLIERAAAPLLGLKPSPRGLEVLALYWGTEPEQLRRFHPWPQRREGEQVVYSERALTHIGKHTREVQRFVFGLLDNAWRLAQPYGGMDVFLETIIGRRLYFRDLATGEYDFVIPDAVLTLTCWKRRWRDNRLLESKQPYCRARLLVEIDRATNPITRLADRIRKYGQIWRGLSGNPVQVWVIDGSPWREKEILALLKEAGVDGWTVRTERLKLPPDDAWWTEKAFRPGTLPYRKHGGLAPLRKIWRRPGDHRLHHLLDQTPWIPPGQGRRAPPPH